MKTYWIRKAALFSLVLTPLLLSGCGLGNFVLRLGNWQSLAATPRHEVDFKLYRFETATRFSNGWFRVEGRYRLQRLSLPRAMELQPLSISCQFDGGGAVETITRKTSMDELAAVQEEFWNQIREVGDIEAAQRFQAFAQSCVQNRPIRCMYVQFPLLLHLAYNMPGTDPPGLFDAAQFREYYRF